MDHPEIGLRTDGPGPEVAALAAADPRPDRARDTGNDDELLGRRLRAREPAALAELYRMHGRQAFGLAYRVLGDGAAAEDAVQAAFLALWERAPRIEPGRGRVRSLLMTIVHRRAVDLVRARSRDAAQLDRSPSGDTAVRERLEAVADERATEHFEHLFEDRSQLRERLQAALVSLPSEQREALQLAYFDGLTHRAIAERLALPAGTVKSRLRLGMEKLRHELGVGRAP